jgi:hypothetical protein
MKNGHEMLWEDLDDEQTHACRSLWCAVLLRTVKDIFSVDCCCEKEGRAYWPRSQLSWVIQARHDYRMVCQMAGVDADALRSAVLAHLAAGTTPQLYGHSAYHSVAVRDGHVQRLRHKRLLTPRVKSV